jgi:Ser/Thr protein kinase RdoA (MazF antagonist)
MDQEEVLAGGNVAAQVVRIGATVRKPVTPATPAVEALLTHLREVGFDGAPRHYGRDEQGRQVLEYVPGPTAHERRRLLTTPELTRVASLIRQLHDALEGFVPPADAAWQVLMPADAPDLIGHYDLAPWNLVMNDERWVFVDWDGAGPGSRLWDLGYAAQSFVPLAADGDPIADGARLQQFADAYGLTEQQREALPAHAAGRARAMSDLLTRSSVTGEQPWARLHSEGHGTYWGGAADYIDLNRERWAEMLS